MKRSAEQFLNAGCELAKPIGLFLGLYQLTGGDPCTTGCAYFKGGGCPAYMSLQVPAKVEAGQEPMETVRDTAKRLGISISEVRRRRQSSPS